MVKMGNDRKVTCILCGKSEETKITGALSTKDNITAHQNCLLFSSGIYCQNSPQFDDLFGFSVDDVMDEVKRGSKLMCYQCKRKGATAGCEVKRCKKSFHYPCAVQEGAHIIEDAEEGKYVLYCYTHHQKMQRKNGSTDEPILPNLQTSKKTSKTAPSKVFCHTCEKTEGNINLDSLSNRIVMLYCNKHAPSSHKRGSHDDTVVARPSFCSSDSSSASSHACSKRKLTFTDKEEERQFKRKPERFNGMVSDNSSDSDQSVCIEIEPNTEMAMFAPLESDLDENANSIPENQSNRKNAKSENPTVSGTQQMDESRNENKDGDDTIIYSDTESESLLPPITNGVEFCSTSSTPFPTASLPLSSMIKAKEVIKRREEAGPSDLEPSMDSNSFWRSCNVAGCTEAIFTDFIDGMKDISRRIQSDLASQEEYDLALKVMAASGKLAEIVTKQQKELQKKQKELQNAVAAMEKAVSAVRK